MGTGENTGENTGSSTGSSGSSLARPNAVTIVSFGSATTSTLTLTWTYNDSYTMDNTYVYLIDNDVQTVYTKLGTATSHTFTGLASGTTYQAYVVTEQGERVSDASILASASTSTETGGGDDWILPVGSYTPSKMDAVISYPRPNTETSSYARYKWAHPDMEYSICVALQGGAWPFKYELVNEPTGMTIGETYGTTQNPNADYGVIRWPAASIPSSGSWTVTINVYEQDGASGILADSVDITITADATKFVFLEKGVAGSNGSGDYNNPVDDIPDILTGHAGKIAVFKNSGTNYNMPLINDATNYEDDVELNPAITPMSFIAEQYNSNATINFFERKCLFPNFRSDFLLYGLTTTGVMKGGGYAEGAPPSKAGAGIDQDIVRQAATRWAIHRCTFTNMQPNPNVDNKRGGNHSVHYIRHSPTTNWNHTSFVRNTLDNVDRLYSAFILYTNQYFVGELNTIKNSTNNSALRPQGFLFTKGANKYTTIRANDCWENNAVDLVNLSAGSDGFDQPYPPANTNGIPHHEEVCWNKLQTSINTNTICTHCAAHDNDSYNYYAYRNTVLGGQFNIHRWVAPTNATQVLNNVALTTASGITVWTGTATETDNIEGSNTGQTTVDELTGLMTDSALAASGYTRGQVGHEVYLEGSVTPPDPPTPTGNLYVDTFESGTYTAPDTNALGAYGWNIYLGNPSGPNYPLDSGVRTDNPKDGSYSMKFEAAFDGTNINSGKFEFYWNTAQPDLYISYDTWVDSTWDCGTGHQKLLAIWSDEYAGDTSTPKKPWAVFETNGAENPTMRVTYQTSSDDGTYNHITRGNTGVDDDDNRATLFTSADLGKWINLKWHIKYSQNPVELGVFELWKDNVLVMRQNIPNHVADDPTGGYKKLYLYGNANEGLAVPCNKYIDNLQISDASGNPIFYDDFSTGDLSKSENGFIWTSSNSDGVADAPVVSSENSLVGANSIKFLFGGTPNPQVTVASLSEQRFDLGGRYTEVWIQFYFYLPLNYYHRDRIGASDNNKLFRLFGGSSATTGASFRPVTETGSQLSYPFVEWTAWPNAGTGPGYSPEQWGTRPPVSLGVWHKYRQRQKLATWTGGVPNNDAVIEAWLDDVKFFDYPTLSQKLAGTTEADNYFDSGYLMGSANSGFDNDTSIYIDAFTIATSESALP